jgi:hypothetical protein
VSSVIVPFVLGPFGAVLAIALGWVARRDIETHRARRRGHRLATVGMALGVVTMLGWAVVGTVVAWIAIERANAAPVAGLPPPVKELPSPPEIGAPGPQATAPSRSPTPPAVQTPKPDTEPGGAVPKTTVARREGTILVVDVGVSARSLADELTKQMAEAKAAGETVLVMTTRDPCDPCRGVDRSLASPLLQTALSNVRLVRVDLDVFRDDLDQLKMPRQRYPGFFLLAPDLTPRDGIDGGEWDDDIPVNIAPVLGPFVRGRYDKRRQGFQPMPGSGIAL